MLILLTINLPATDLFKCQYVKQKCTHGQALTLLQNPSPCLFHYFVVKFLTIPLLMTTCKYKNSSLFICKICLHENALECEGATR